MRYLYYFLGLLLAGYLFTGVTQVRPGEQAVVRRFGRVIATPGPGLWIGLPWGMERVDRVAVDQVKKLEVGYQPGEEDSRVTPAGQLLTGDHNLVNVQVVLHYTVAPKQGGRADGIAQAQVERYFLQSERAEALLARAAESVMTEWVAGQTVDEILIHGKAVLPELLIQRVQDRIEPYQLGIEIQSASVGQLAPPREVQSDFAKVAEAQSSILTQELKAREDANRRLRQAEADKYQSQQATAGYVHKQLEMAGALAESFDKDLRQYQGMKDKDAFLAGLWWREMGKLFQGMKDNGRVDILDQNLGGGEVDITLYLPRKK